MLNKQKATDFIESLYDDIWMANNLNKISDYYHPEYRGYVDNQEIDYQELVKFALHESNHSKDKTFKLQDILSEEDKIAFRFKADGLHDGKFISYIGFIFFYLKEGKIHRAYSTFEPKINVLPSS